MEKHDRRAPGPALRDALQNFGLISKLIACVKDGGANLLKSTSAMKEVTTFKPFHMPECMSGVFLALIISGAANAALLKTVGHGFPMIYIEKVRLSLQDVSHGPRRHPRGEKHGWMHVS